MLDSRGNYSHTLKRHTIFCHTIEYCRDGRHAGTEYAACVPSPSVFCSLVVCDFSQKAKRIHGNHSKRSASSRVVSPKRDCYIPRSPRPISIVHCIEDRNQKDTKVKSKWVASVHIARYEQSKVHVFKPNYVVVCYEMPSQHETEFHLIVLAPY